MKKRYKYVCDTCGAEYWCTWAESLIAFFCERDDCDGKLVYTNEWDYFDA